MQLVATKSQSKENLTETLRYIDSVNTKPVSIWHNRNPANTSSVCDAVNAITTLAMLDCNVIHIHISFHAHTNAFEVRVNSAGTDYKKPSVMLSEYIYLDKAWALEQLKTLEDKLIDLVAQAKDEAMGAC